jgi:peptidoglycan hydrolase CwlO-like protein
MEEYVEKYSDYINLNEENNKQITTNVKRIQKTIDTLNNQLEDLRKTNQKLKDSNNPSISSIGWINDSTIDTLEHHASKLVQLNLIK